MEYRVLPHGGEKISVIGLGAGSLSGTEEEMAALLDTAILGGINYFDIAPSVRAPFFAYAKAFDGRRDQIITQMHFGAIYPSGKYVRLPHQREGRAFFHGRGPHEDSS